MLNLIFVSFLICGLTNAAPSDPCEESQFTCSSTKDCIPLSWRCDGEDDCPNGEDEFKCRASQCPSSHIRCSDSGRCIPNEWICDGSNDCENGEDETDCSKRSCLPDQFKCNSGICLPNLLVCDGDKDCPGNEGEDEKNDACLQVCTPEHGRFICNSTQTCIWDFYRCDGMADCADGLDEVNCGGQI